MTPGLRYWRIWRRFVGLAVAQLLEYRANALLSLLDTAAQLGLLVVVYLIFYRFTDDVAGWSRAESLVLLGVFWTFDGVWGFQFSRSLPGLSALIKQGDLDFVLLRPVSSQFLVTCWRGVNVKEATKVVQGVLLTAYAGRVAGVEWSATGVLAAGLFGLCGLALLYALRFAIATCTFWVLQVSELYELFGALFSTARFPVTYFREPVRSVLTYVVPVAFATTFPAQALLGTADMRLLPVGVLLAGAALLATNRFWHYAVRYYSSASS
ncbi:MAG: ABC-2 family transporter protein [Chloroflexota bacterium]|nr:ABC-2 family transporter protein [Chloroflexota bacterium]